jgi:hypothetical protein
MYFDGSLKLEGDGAGVLLISPKGEQLKYVLQIFLKVLNNEAKYESLTSWASPRNLFGHQAATSLRRLSSGHQPIQQDLGSQQGEHGRLLSGSSQAREQVLRF